VAKDKGKSESQQAGGFVIPAIVAALLGIVGGGAFGYFVLPDPASPVQASQKDIPAEVPPTAGRFPNDAIELAVPSVITDLDSDPKVRARLDVSIIVAHGTPETTTLLGEVREDVMAYLKGLTLADIQGIRGFQNLREQLDDRAKIRGRGAILGLLIGGLVLE
jgi:flagellar protein FliL